MAMSKSAIPYWSEVYPMGPEPRWYQCGKHHQMSSPRGYDFGGLVACHLYTAHPGPCQVDWEGVRWLCYNDGREPEMLLIINPTSKFAARLIVELSGNAVLVPNEKLPERL